MPLAKLREKQKAARAEVLAHGHRGTEKQAPEPMNRMLRREMVQDRRVTKQGLRTLINQVPTAQREGVFHHICD